MDLATQGHDAGIGQLAITLNALPPDTIVYEYSLDWELAFYLGDQPRVHLIFEPSPQGLARTVCASDQPVYFAASVKGVTPWFLPLRKRGARITELTSGPLRLYLLNCTF